MVTAITSHLYANPDFTTYYKTSILYRSRIYVKMAAFGDEETSQSESPTEEIKALRYACSSILNDELFMLPSEESEM